MNKTFEGRFERVLTHMNGLLFIFSFVLFYWLEKPFSKRIYIHSKLFCRQIRHGY